MTSLPDLRALLVWCEDEGLRIDPRVCLAHSPTAGVHILATASIAPDETRASDFCFKRPFSSQPVAVQVDMARGRAEEGRRKGLSSFSVSSVEIAQLMNMLYLPCWSDGPSCVTIV